MFLHERIQSKLDEKKLKQADIARATKKSTAAVTKWLRGENIPKADSLKEIARLLDVSDEWLLTGKEPKPHHNQEGTPVFAWESPEDLDPNLYVIIPHVEVKFSAGNGRTAAYEPSQCNAGSAQPLSWVHKKKISPKNLVTVDIDGDSMEPNIRNGSVVMLDKSINTLEQVQSGRVYAIRYGDELKIKRLSKRFDGALVIDSDNPLYKREIVEPDQLEHIGIIGRYVSHSYDGDI
ncbi:hypothetical protein B9T31_14810 [Acinetobacter sp. ANC 4558]|uniref:S24 family peptidase n=1 Tax=Acinetobacter sp. ANC 4558 TaxID=1977876 RepID=UPI000A33C857|nr:S24 family peptidase [Acinetobacter sp. ANC 4558]OTG82559.1 hypothetical protein B9T31_14810 [Acinetobacter sp. ANC 4558]